MSINNIIMYIMIFFTFVGGVDRIFGNKFGYGKKFEEGILAMGPLAMAMLGIISLSPLISNFLKPIIAPLYQFIGADPAMFAGTILANDMGGYSLGTELALTREAGLLSGLILSATLGATLSFSIPVALGLVEKEDEKYLSDGILAGLLTIPFGCFVGGIVAGFNIKLLLINLFPIFIFTILISFGLSKYPKKIAKGFSIFGKFMMIVITIGFCFQVLETLTGIIIIPGMYPATEAIKIVCRIGMVLSGAFPFVFFITTTFKKPLIKIGGSFGMNENSMSGFIACLAHNIPMFMIVKDMDPKGKVLNIAFSVSGAFVLGSHLGFTAGIDKSMVFPVITAKIVGGISAMIVANYFYNKNLKNN